MNVHCMSYLSVCNAAAAEVKPHLTSWKEKSELARKLLTLLNAFTPPDIRATTFGMDTTVLLYVSLLLL